MATHLAEFSFRQAEPADALCIGVLGMQVFLDTYATEGVRPTIAREVLESLSPDAVAEVMARGSVFVLAETQNHLVGFAQWRARAEHELVSVPEATQAAELERLYVQERFTGRGLGSALLAHAEEGARRGPASAMWLTAWIGNQRALAFYLRRGYQPVGSTIFEFQGEQHENRLFIKPLP